MEKNKYNKFRKFWKKFWFIVWKDDSIKGWLISILFLFIVIRFIFFPVLNVVTGTSLPLAIVESCSMHHKANVFSGFENWWERHEAKYNAYGITKTEFQEFEFRRGFSKGDILFIVGKKPEKLKEGDIIIFDAGQNHPIIHRIISIRQQDGEYTFSTVGDNNNGQLSFEKNISQDELVGKAVFRVTPYLGWIKLVFYESSKQDYEKGVCNEN